MTLRPLLMALILSLAVAGAGHAADDRDPDTASTATPRVSCDLFDVRTDAPRATSTAASANPQGGGSAIRRVGGRGTFLAGNGGFLKVGLTIRNELGLQRRVRSQGASQPNGHSRGAGSPGPVWPAKGPAAPALRTPPAVGARPAALACPSCGVPTAYPRHPDSDPQAR